MRELMEYLDLSMKPWMKKAYREAICPINKFCDFRVVLSNDEVQKEVCRFCNKRLMFNVIDGKIDNERYKRAHIRAFVQPIGQQAEIYEMIYGSQAFKEIDARIKEKLDREERQKEMDYEFDKAIEGGKKTTYYGGQTSFK